MDRANGRPRWRRVDPFETAPPVKPIAGDARYPVTGGGGVGGREAGWRTFCLSPSSAIGGSAAGGGGVPPAGGPGITSASFVSVLGAFDATRVVTWKVTRWCGLSVGMTRQRSRRSRRSLRVAPTNVNPDGIRSQTHQLRTASRPRFETVMR